MKKKLIAVLVIVLIIGGFFIIKFSSKNSVPTININLTSLKYQVNGKVGQLKIYTETEFETFLNDYKSDKLPDIYITNFLFDGVGMYAPYDLDDFKKNGNDMKTEPVYVSVLNIHTNGNITFKGDFTGMLAVNTNDITGPINLIFSGVNIDTDTKKVPAIYVYNKDNDSTSAKVTIIADKDTKNYVSGGKLKKISLIPKDALDRFASSYSGTTREIYDTYPNYYGLYTTEEIENILFHRVESNRENMRSGDPYFVYKAAGAVSSDVDLYFEGAGYLEITSKNKEGIESKANITFSGGIGDYVVNSYDDGINAANYGNPDQGVRNTLTIDVNSLYVNVLMSGKEGDALDSNGALYINGGNILVKAKPGLDAGIQFYAGCHLNGGTILSTGDKYFDISENAKQNIAVFVFNGKTNPGDLLVLKDSNDKVVFAYKTDREYKYLVYSSPSLINGTYHLYKNGTINGTVKDGYYTSVTSYEPEITLGFGDNNTKDFIMDKLQNMFEIN